MKYWDSSAIVPLLVEQDSTPAAVALYRDDPELIVWWGTRVECDSAVARLEREGCLTPEAASAALARVDLLSRTWSEVQPGASTREIARRLLRSHALRAADSLQLAAAIIAAENSPKSMSFICRDDRLLLAARREGFIVLPT